jgi:Predicted integral membrane protein (DUF2269)
MRGAYRQSRMLRPDLWLDPPGPFLEGHSGHGADDDGAGACGRALMDFYTLLKLAHVIGAAVLFGTGVGIAFFMLMMWWTAPAPGIEVP